MGKYSFILRESIPTIYGNSRVATKARRYNKHLNKSSKVNARQKNGFITIPKENKLLI